MTTQKTLQIGTYGINVADKINEWLADNPGYRVVAVRPLPVFRIGGMDRHVLVVFQKDDVVSLGVGDELVNSLRDVANSIREAYRTLR